MLGLCEYKKCDWVENEKNPTKNSRTPERNKLERRKEFFLAPLKI